MGLFVGFQEPWGGDPLACANPLLPCLRSHQKRRLPREMEPLSQLTQDWMI